jgi:xanthine dehydrogenase small subunit
MTELYRGYRQLALEPGEIITHVTFDRTRPNETLRLFKVSQRKDLDISTVSAAYSILWEGRRGKGVRRIAEARVAYGGVAATPVRLAEIERDLVGDFTREKAERIAQAIAAAVKPLSDVRGTAAYRSVLAANLFRQFAGEVLDG